MTVYFIRAGDENGPVKIGLSHAAPQRLSGMQTSSADALVLLREIDGGPLVERWLHRKFAASRIRGEWFEFDAQMLTIEAPTALVIDDLEGDVPRFDDSATFFDFRIEQLRAGLHEPDDVTAARLLAWRAGRERDSARHNAAWMTARAESAQRAAKPDLAVALAQRARVLLGLAELWQAKYVALGGDAISGVVDPGHVARWSQP